MKEVDYTDSDGRRHRVLVPEDCPTEIYHQGIPVGPPSLAPLGLPLATEVRLHNQLHGRGLFTTRDVLRNPVSVQAALQAALKLDVQTVQALYSNQGG